MNQHSTHHIKTEDLQASISSLTWEQRLKIVETFRLSDTRACKLFNMTMTNYRDTKDQYNIDATFDAEPFRALFKRGKKSTKIRDAINTLTSTPVPLEQFCQENGISINTITQQKRFGITGINIYTDKNTKTRNIVKV